MIAHYMRTPKNEEELEKDLMDIYNFDPKKDKRFRVIWGPYLFSTEMVTENIRHEDLQAQELLDEIHNKRLYGLIKKYNVSTEQEITEDRIVEAMKYLCETTDKPYLEVLEGLLARGFYWTVNNVGDQYEERRINILDGLTNGEPEAAACVIGNVFDGHFSYQIVKDQYLTHDTYRSGFQYIRTVTGDESYTKENIFNKDNITKKLV